MKKQKKFVYGDKNTIHRTGHLDVELDPAGNVTAVWFRCLRLPFKVNKHGRTFEGGADVAEIINVKVLEKEKK